MFIAAYGTLRPGLYNFNRFDLKPVKTVRIKGFKLFDLGPYPYVIESEDPDASIVVDILETDEYEYEKITRMEIYAGYEAKQIDIEGIECTIYTFPKQVINTTEVTDGDYKSYKAMV